MSSPHPEALAMADRSGHSMTKRTPSSRPTQPPGIEETRQDVRRLEHAVRRACEDLLRAIHEHPETRAAYERWERARDRHTEAETRLDILLAARKNQ